VIGAAYKQLFHNIFSRLWTRATVFTADSRSDHANCRSNPLALDGDHFADPAPDRAGEATMSKLVSVVALLCLVILSVPAFAQTACQQRCITGCSGKGTLCLNKCETRCSINGTARRTGN
jgi:hypothetical protein